MFSVSVKGVIFIIFMVTVAILGWVVLFEGKSIDSPSALLQNNSSFVERLLSEPQSFFAMMLFFVTIIQLPLIFRSNKAAIQSAQAANKSAEIANGTLIASQRAWLRVEVSIGNQPLIMNENGASLSVSFKVKNLGNTPAINIQTLAWMGILKNGGPFAAQVLQEKCDEARHEPRGGGVMLFPQEKFPDGVTIGQYDLGINVPTEDFQQALRERRAQNPNVGVDTIGGLFVVGCVTYTFPSDISNQHQTRFIYDLNMRGPHVITLQASPIPSTDLELRRSILVAGQIAD